MQSEAPRTTKGLVLQQDYNTKRGADSPDNWKWVDVGIALKGETRDDEIAFARAFVARQTPSNWTRGYRVVERETTIVDTPVEILI